MMSSETKMRQPRLHAPRIASSSPERAPRNHVEFAFVESPQGGRLLLCEGHYTREFLERDQPFWATKQEFETYLRPTRKFKEV